MASNTHIVEIVPPGFTHHDWFRKAAGAAGLVYHRFEADMITGTVDGPDLAKCKKLPVEKRVKQPCSDLLRDQNVHIDISRWRQEMAF